MASLPYAEREPSAAAREAALRLVEAEAAACGLRPSGSLSCAGATNGGVLQAAGPGGRADPVRPSADGAAAVAAAASGAAGDGAGAAWLVHVARVRAAHAAARAEDAARCEAFGAAEWEARALAAEQLALRVERSAAEVEREAERVNRGRRERQLEAAERLRALEEDRSALVASVARLERACAGAEAAPQQARRR